MDEAKTRETIRRAESVAMIRYTGDSGAVTIRSRWQERADVP
jgi:hypothetical protein